MRKGSTELVFIIDRSGSMGGLEADTIGGFNAFIERQKKEEGDAIVSVVLFDDRQDVIYDRVDLAKVEPMTDKQYYVRGCTALLDALGGAIHHIGIVHKYAREEDRPEKTLFIITTDGYENASSSYSYKEVQKMIRREKEKYGWEFLFLGADIDAIGEAGKVGIDAGRAARCMHDSEGTQLQYEVLGNTIAKVRAKMGVSAAGALSDLEDWAAPIREDYARRSR